MGSSGDWALVTLFCVVIGGCIVDNVASSYFDAKAQGVAQRLDAIEQRLDALEDRVDAEERP